MNVPKIVPAGASRPGDTVARVSLSESNVRCRLDFSKPAAQITLTNDEDEDDDPFGVGPTTSKSKFIEFSFDPAVRSTFLPLRSTNISFQPAPPKPVEPIAEPANPSKNDIDFGSSNDEDEDPLFGQEPGKATLPPVSKPTPVSDENSWSNDEENEKEEKKESEDEQPEVKKPAGVSMFGPGAGMSPLEAAVAARRRKVGGIEEPEKSETAEEKVKRTPFQTNDSRTKPLFHLAETKTDETPR